MILALLFAIVQPAHACKVHETYPADGEVVRPGHEVFAWRATGDCTMVPHLNGEPWEPDGHGEVGFWWLIWGTVPGDRNTMTFFDDREPDRKRNEVEFTVGDWPATQDELAPETLEVVITPDKRKLHTIDATASYAGAAGELLVLQVNGRDRDWAVTTGDPDEVYELRGQNDRQGWRSCVQVARVGITGSRTAFSEETCQRAVACSSTGGTAPAVFLAGLAVVGLRRRRRSTADRPRGPRPCYGR